MGELEEHHLEFELCQGRGGGAESGRALAGHEQLRFLLLSGIETGFDLNEGKYEDCCLK